MNISWKRGEYIKFKAQMKIRVGGKENVTIEMDDEVEYDGTMLKYAGSEIAQPSLRGAIKNNWLVPIEDPSAPIANFDSNRNMAASQSVNTNLSKVVRQGPGIAVDSLDEDTVLKVGDRGEAAKTGGHITQSDNRRTSGRIKHDISDEQEGKVIGKVRTATNETTDVSKDGAYGKKIQELANPAPIGKKPNLQPRKIIQEGVEITISGGMDSEIQTDLGDEGTVVAQVRHSKTNSSEGITVKDTSGPQGIQRNGSAPQQSAPRQQSGQTIDAKIPAKIRMARYIDPSFPSGWSFSGKLAERMARVKEHGITPVFLEALYAAEGDQFRKLLETEFPKQFSAS